MPRSEEQNEKIKQKRREELIDAAIKVFAIKGYEKATCDDITNEIGCSHGLFYRYFTSKDDIYNVATLKYKTKYIEMLSEVLEGENNSKEALEKLTNFFIEEINQSIKNAYEIFVCLTSIVVKNNKSKDIDEKFFSILKKLFLQGNQEYEGIDDNYASVLTLSYYYMLIGMCYMRIGSDSNSEKIYSSSTILDWFKSSQK